MSVKVQRQREWQLQDVATDSSQSIPFHLSIFTDTLRPRSFWSTKSIQNCPRETRVNAWKQRALLLNSGHRAVNTLFDERKVQRAGPPMKARTPFRRVSYRAVDERKIRDAANERRDWVTRLTRSSLPGSRDNRGLTTGQFPQVRQDVPRMTSQQCMAAAGSTGVCQRWAEQGQSATISHSGEQS